MGVITTVDIPAGYAFGPLPTDVMITDPANLIWQISNDLLSELPTIRMNLLKQNDPKCLIDWICCIRVARNPIEQNFELVKAPFDNGYKYFYISTRPIRPEEEILVWLRRIELTPILFSKMISDLSSTSQSEKSFQLLKFQSILQNWLGQKSSFDTPDAEGFKCLICGMQYKYIYPYVAHRIFKCQNSVQKVSTSQKGLPNQFLSKISKNITRSNSNNSLVQLECPRLNLERKVFVPDAKKRKILTDSYSNPNISKTREERILQKQAKNPMVEKILSSISSDFGSESFERKTNQFSFTENWCAKCSMSFKITSDLVHHMRSQHKNEKSSGKYQINFKKGKEGIISGEIHCLAESFIDPKLMVNYLKPLRMDEENFYQEEINILGNSCDICGERFKEKHHLTRHLVSHT